MTVHSELDRFDRATRAFLSLAIVLMVAGMAWLLITRQVPDQSRETVGGIIGALLVILKDVYASTFNVSASTARKDATIAEIAKSVQSAPTIPTGGTP